MKIQFKLKCGHSYEVMADQYEWIKRLDACGKWVCSDCAKAKGLTNGTANLWKWLAYHAAKSNKTEQELLEEGIRLLKENAPKPTNNDFFTKYLRGE